MVKGIDTEQSSRRILDSCFGRYIHVHDLPGKFNVNILKNCSALFIWSKKCDPLSNSGLGLETEDSGEILQRRGWYATNLILVQPPVRSHFHNRVEKVLVLDE
ncbi:hypothetical protein POM88_047026 [Heracleum sosnowskyi]|uniref:Uncharacterized protein n=1 Tax=Heracleum sosnowskyi TaxID=360622 RepID=A0AAD8M7N6_9APIA|nr:hypothetical protein POM88_047026 [Heracleum sosnowskyi]